MYDQKQWATKSAIITGAGSGIGLETAKIFSSLGCQVLGIDLPNSQMEEKLKDTDVVCMYQDLTQDQAARKILDTAVAHFNGVDIVANIAGIGKNAMIEQLSDASFQEVLDVNLIAPMRLVRECIPVLKQSDSGRVINITSIMAKFTDKGLSSYSAAKAGLAGLTRTLAYELAYDKITVNHIMPGAIVTGMTQAFKSPEIAEIWRKKAALRRLGQPEDIANVIVFLASNEAGFITGQGIGVDGGMMLRV